MPTMAGARSWEITSQPHTGSRMKERDAGQGNKPLKPTPFDILSLARLYHLKVLLHPQTVPATQDQVLKHVKLWETFLI